MTTLKTHAQVRDHFVRTGTAVKEWAKAHGLAPATVYEVLAGRRKCLRGDSHKAAVLLGLKDGEIVERESHLSAEGGTEQHESA
ncbi:DNA-binding protein [Burkholderia arboris]|uniref:DNA-binding protein n=1 Tax=Burkholderia metallica TaxID=488729 RepID=A0ABT8PJA4_9BURK|nr:MULTISPECIES: DNA-binding protein [Burkholderia cepacia complex]MCA8031987.1 DNA-binding protein [Burkholderia arboris]MDN7935157.1 DNA-binding protein [Burkholderia metallica]